MISRELPKNLSAEPAYSEHFTVCFSIRFPNFTCHRKHPDCGIEEGHKIEECGLFIFVDAESLDDYNTNHDTLLL